MIAKDDGEKMMYPEAWGVHLAGKGKLTKEDREKLLSKLHRLLVFIGCEIPFEVKLEGKTVPLHELVWRIMTHQGTLTPEEFAAVEELHREIEEKIREEELGIKSANISEAEARELYVEACGLIRAAVALRDIEKRQMLHDYSEVEASAKVGAEKRWLEYLKKIR
ncbi:MAG: DUF5788 family protein [Halobacteriota archaeon]